MTSDPIETTPLRGNERGEGWHLKPRRRWLTILGVAFLVTMLLLGVGAAASEGEWGGVVVLLVVAVAFASIPLAGRRRRVSPLLVSDGQHGPGLLLPIHGMSPLFVFGSAVLGLLLLLAPVAAVTGEADTAGGRVGALVVSIIPAAIGLLFLLGAWSGVTAARRRGKGLLLTPTVLVLNTQDEPVAVPWDAVRGVRPHWTRFRPSTDLFRSPEDPVNNWLSFPVDPARVVGPNPLGPMAGTDAPTLDAEKIAVHREGAVVVLNHYLAHPSARAELGGPSSLAQARRLLDATASGRQGP